MSDSDFPSRPSATSRTRWLDPRNDLVFKLLLTGPESEDVLVYVLNAVIRPSSPIRSARVLSGRFEADRIDAKEIAFDVRALLEDGSEIDVEMQCRPVKAFRERLVYYGVRPLADQLEAGEGYDQLRPSVVIAFLGYAEFADDRFHRRFRLADASSNEELSRLLEIHTIELPKVERLDASEATRHDPLVVFSRLLMARSDEERAEVAMEADAMKQAVKILDTLASDDELRRLAEDRAARIKLDEMYRRRELREAKDAAEREGREDERRAILKRAITNVRDGRVSVDVVASLLGVDVSEVERLVAAESGD